MHFLFLTALLLTASNFYGVEAQVNAPPNGGTGASVDNHSRLEQETFSLINQYRKDHQFVPFQWAPAITEVARKHSRDMATGESDFGHDGFRQRVSQLRGVMPGLNGAGENVLRTNDPNLIAERAVDSWLKSPHHLANIRGDFNYSGLGIWEDEQGMVYFTQIFVKLVPPKPEAPPAPPPQVQSPFSGYLAAPQTR